MVTELETKDIVPIKKFVPLVIRAAAQKVKSKTGTSAQVSEVKSRTVTTTMATSTLMICISPAICSAEASPMVVDT